VTRRIVCKEIKYSGEGRALGRGLIYDRIREDRLAAVIVLVGGRLAAF
jgi:hypothetical protein